MKSLRLRLLFILATGMTAESSLGADPAESLFNRDSLDVRITEALSSLELRHEGEPVLLMRHQDPDHRIDAPYDKTARHCPPYCVQPMQIAPGVETIGELELIDYLKQIDGGDTGVMVIDSRTHDWIERGTIPGAVHIPYRRIDPAHASPQQIAELLQLEFDAVAADGIWNFDAVKTLVFFGNGAWCGQSPTSIKALRQYGYPAHRIKWYRGGMQAWETLGLTTVPVRSIDTGLDRRP